MSVSPSRSSSGLSTPQTPHTPHTPLSSPQPLRARPPAWPGTPTGPVRISTKVRAILEDRFADCSLTELLTSGLGRGGSKHPVLEPDTPVHGRGFPRSKGATSFDRPVAAVFDPAAIMSSDTFSIMDVVQTPLSPKSSVASKVFHFLMEGWSPIVDDFMYRASQSAVSELYYDLLCLCAEATTLLQAEPVYLKLPTNIFVLGDIHGNFHDLHFFMDELLLFRDITLTPHSFLLLGDYVDRGPFSVECVLLCLALKCLSPSTFFMLRGNHEDPLVNGDTEVYQECLLTQCIALFGEALGRQAWRMLNSTFQALPLAACIGGKIFCSHGGIPRHYGGPETDDRLELLRSPEFPRFPSLFDPLRPGAVEEAKLMRFWQVAFDLVWSDPSDHDDAVNRWGFGPSERGEEVVTFSEVAVENFLRTFGFELLLRAHQEKSDGLRLSKNAKCLTIFTTSNYSGHRNGAGVAHVSSAGRVRLILKDPRV